MGDTIVNFDFGAGPNPGGPLAATNYTYFSDDCPTDGFYTVRSNTSQCFGNTWHTLTQDHTGNANGYFMLINASVEPRAFYVDTVRGLCPNTTYEFAGWIMNVVLPSACNGNANQPNITFSIEQTDGTVLQSTPTGNIPPTLSPTWIRKPAFFTTGAGSTDIVLRMVNNAAGGCGNDLALDDITFRACGPLVTLTITGSNSNTASICEGANQTVNLSASVSAGYNMPAYQWQQSFNGGAYTNIAGQNTTNLQFQSAANVAVGVYNFRLQVAEASNFSSPQCRTSSSPITITVNPKPTAVITGNSPLCENNSIVLSASGGVSYDWQGPANFTSTASQLVLPNAQLPNGGNYTVKVTAANGCFVLVSTNIVVNPAPVAIATAISDTICAGTGAFLQATGGDSYSWFPIQFLSSPLLPNTQAAPLQSMSYNVEVKNTFGCADTASVNLTIITKLFVNAGIDQISIPGKPIQLAGNISGNFQSFSWSPNSFITDVSSLTPVVTPPGDFKYILTAVNYCGIVSDSVEIKIYNGIFIPSAFTPNGDGKNDTWNVFGLEAYPNHQLTLFNRYGQVVFERKSSFAPWNGFFNGQLLPAGAYTYLINLNNATPVLKGTILMIK
ncbi:MAG: gliding motility-associated C-terminal domain-containing protein [Ferruginibacter sp.]